MNIQHIMQEHETGCGIACIAMVTGKTYKEIFNQLKNQDWYIKRGLHNELLDRLLVLNNILPIRHTNILLIEGKTYIVTVPSLNYLGGLHWIVIQQEPKAQQTVYDPNKGIKGKKLYKSNRCSTWCSPIEIKDIFNNSEIIKL